MLGKPKYKYGEQIHFKFNEMVKMGKIFVVDSYGTFFQTEEPSYDIMVEEERCVYKHVPESNVFRNNFSESQ